MTSIPASELVSVVPSVLGAGGNPLSLNAIFLTDDPAVPIGTVPAFATLASVQDFFGASSDEATLAAVYFNGFNGCTTFPGQLYFAQFNTVAVAAYLRSGSLASMTLAALQALSGTVIVAIDGETVTSANIDLSSATSFSNAAALIQTGLQTLGGIFSGTATQSGTTLTVSAVASGVLHVGDSVVGANIGPATVVQQLTGTPGGIGTYEISTTETVAVGETVTVSSTATVSYDAQRAAFVISSPTTGDDSTIAYATGTLAAGIKLQSAQGAVLSPGADAAVPADFMAAIIATTQNWATFMTTFDPSDATRLAFASWVATSNDRYAYVAHDDDVGPTQSNDDADCFAQLTATYDGVIPVWGPADKAAFICAIAGSLNPSETNGRATFAFRSGSGLTFDVTDATIAANLIANGYNFYGAYATANQQFTFLQPGQINGEWHWIDPYVNQIYLNSQLQLAFMSLLSQVKSVPYNQDGYNMLRAAALDPINEALNFGTIRAGVSLSASQKAQVNTQANANIAPTLESTGWFLKVADPGAIVRGQRGSPAMVLWYTDGGSIQRINLASINVE